MCEIKTDFFFNSKDSEFALNSCLFCNPTLFDLPPLHLHPPWLSMLLNMCAAQTVLYCTVVITSWSSTVCGNSVSLVQQPLACPAEKKHSSLQHDVKVM